MKKLILTSVTIVFIGVAAFAGDGNKKNEKKCDPKECAKQESCTKKCCIGECTENAKCTKESKKCGETGNVGYAPKTEATGNNK
jgi:hypothetical protein